MYVVFKNWITVERTINIVIVVILSMFILSNIVLLFLISFDKAVMLFLIELLLLTSMINRLIVINILIKQIEEVKLWKLG
jgi:hypothetical protein